MGENGSKSASAVCAHSSIDLYLILDSRPPNGQEFHSRSPFSSPSVQLERVKSQLRCNSESIGSSSSASSTSKGATAPIPTTSSPRPSDTFIVDMNDLKKLSRRHSSPQIKPDRRLDNSLPSLGSLQGIYSDEEFRRTVGAVQEAIECGIQPLRISQGSSGSYFVRNKNGRILGVFKPKNEEPYGTLNPKWIKWLHKTCCPCFFGRSCLIANLGYISEAAASALDRKLSLNIVPRTEVVELASPAFNYSWIDRKNKDKKGLPKKIGSFQIFLSGYRDAGLVIRDILDTSVSEMTSKQFQLSFERLVILDYLMRNTDRGMDNWMIYYGRPEDDELIRPEAGPSSSKPEEASMAEGNEDNQTSMETSWQVMKAPVVRIAGIDNGLAFPHKHPDQWRSYPYGWAWLSCAHVPFSEETRQIYLAKLSDIRVCEEVIEELRRIFMIDSDFDGKLFEKQMAVFRGQWHNLVESLQSGDTPFDLVRKPLMMIFEEDGVFPADPEDFAKSMDRDGVTGPFTPFVKKWKKMMVQVKPFFSCW